MHHGLSMNAMRVQWKIPSFIRIGRHRIMLSIPISSSAASDILQNMFFDRSSVRLGFEFEVIAWSWGRLLSFHFIRANMHRMQMQSVTQQLNTVLITVRVHMPFPHKLAF